MKIKEIIDYLDQIAPPSIQESYDNTGLQVGDPQREVTGILCCLDSTEEVVEEAIQKGCNVVLAHHPLLFHGIKRIGTENHVERTVSLAIKNDITIFAVHTNLDKVLPNGVNEAIAKRLGLVDILPLRAGQNLLSFSFHAEEHKVAPMVDSLNEFCRNVYSIPGHGSINIHGIFSTLSDRHFQKFAQEFGLDISEVECVELHNADPLLGTGLVGRLVEAYEENVFLDFVKERMKSKMIRHTTWIGQKVETVAVCGGSGSFLIPDAIKARVQAYITSDLKYHDFFEADKKLILCDIGHYESEQFTIKLLHRLIKEKFTNFAAYLTKVNSNPVNYK